jgi:hypothetical protein
MHYRVKTPPSELNHLVSLIGQPLDGVAVDGWSAELRSGTVRLKVVPEEVATPDADHPTADVERPMIRLDDSPTSGENGDVVAERLGLVRAVNVFSILVGFSPVVDCPAQEILPGLVLPPSRGYGCVYFAPEKREQAEIEVGDGSLVDLDRAFELVTDECTSLVVYTTGFFVRVSLQGAPVDEDWVKLGTYTRRPLCHGNHAESGNAASREP